MAKSSNRPAPGGNWFWADNRVVDEYLPRIGHAAFIVYICLAREAKSSRTCYRSPAQIAAASRFSKSTVSRAIKTLQETGLVEIVLNMAGEKGYRLCRLRGPKEMELFPSDAPPNCCTSATPRCTPATNCCTSATRIYKEKQNKDSSSADPPAEEGAAAAAPAVAAAAFLQGEKTLLFAELKARGLSADQANDQVQTADPAFIREVLDYHAWRRSAPGIDPLREPLRALLGMLTKPKKWGFSLENGVWELPADFPRPGSSPIAEAELLAKVEAERERSRQEAARFAPDGKGLCDTERSCP
jgi:hypothetical protein